MKRRVGSGYEDGSSQPRGERTIQSVGYVKRGLPVQTLMYNFAYKKIKAAHLASIGIPGVPGDGI